MWKERDDYGDGPFVPQCSFCGKSMYVTKMESKEVRGITRYFCEGTDHSRLYEEIGEKTLARARVLHNTDPIGDAYLEMWLECVKALPVKPGA